MIRPLHLLLIEDDVDSGEAMSALLRSEGIRVDWARTGAEAIEVLRRDPTRPMDAILLDLMLPDTNSVALMARLRRIAPLPPVIIHSAASESEIRDMEVRLGAAAAFRKPTDWKKLREALADCRSAAMA